LPPPAHTSPAGRDGLRVLTLNVAHGRKDGPNQLWLRCSTIRRNLRSVADLIRRVAPDVVALQEADGPSRWSGGFDHVQELAERAGYAWTFRGDHARGWLYCFGTALLSRVPLEATESVRFSPTPPTPRKGFVIGELRWPGSGLGPPETPGTVDVISVHFDFLRRTARERQLEELAHELERRSKPVIVLGDFNSEWSVPSSVVRRLAERRGLHTHDHADDLRPTHESLRIDWILASREFRFLRVSRPFLFFLQNRQEKSFRSGKGLEKWTILFFAFPNII